MARTYKVKRPEPLPRGDIYLNGSGMGGAFIGKAASRNSTGSYPAYPFHAIIRQGCDEYKDPVGGREIGYMKGWVLRYPPDGLDFFAMIDALEGESTAKLRKMVHAYCDQSGHFLEKVSDMESGELLLILSLLLADLTGDLVFVQEIYLQPRFRGYGISLLALAHFMKYPGYCQIRMLIASKPFAPAQFHDPSDPLATAKSSEEHQAALESLGRHWELLEFEDRETEGIGEDVQFWSRWMDDDTPMIRRIVPHISDG